MPRTARQKSQSDIYHIMLRGIDKQNIFEDDEDKEKFLSILKDCQAISGYGIFAYCLMNNHAHILLKEGKENLGQIFKRIGARYVYWYNWKYQRTGHLFQDRFKSEPVEDDAYFLSVLQYIHQNPVTAGLVKAAEEYAYSSYKEYIKNKKSSFVDSRYVYEIIEKKEFIRIHKEKADVAIGFAKGVVRKTDEEAKSIIQKIIKSKDFSIVQAMGTNEKAKHIQSIHAKGISVRQMSRLTGLSKGVIERSLKI